MTIDAPNAGQTLVIVLPSILSFLTAALAAVLSYLAHRGTSDLRLHVNSRLDELLQTTKELAHANGVAEGAKTERDRGNVLTSFPPSYVPDTRPSG